MELSSSQGSRSSHDCAEAMDYDDLSLPDCTGTDPDVKPPTTPLLSFTLSTEQPRLSFSDGACYGSEHNP